MPRWGWWMINAGLCDTSFFLCEPETFWHWQLQDWDFKTFKMRTWDVQVLRHWDVMVLWDFLSLAKKWDITATKTRLRDRWNWANILRDPLLLKDHLPPLVYMRSRISCIHCIVLDISTHLVTLRHITYLFLGHWINGGTCFSTDRVHKFIIDKELLNI